MQVEDCKDTELVRLMWSEKKSNVLIQKQNDSWTNFCTTISIFYGGGTDLTCKAHNLVWDSVKYLFDIGWCEKVKMFYKE